MPFIDINDVDPATREAAFGDGLTADERMERSVGQYVTAEQLLAMQRSVRDEMQRQVERGEMVPVVSTRGVVGWHPVRRGRA